MEVKKENSRIIRILSNIVESYSLGLSEWILQYRVCYLLLFFMLDAISCYFIFGVSLLYIVLLIIIKFLIGIHVIVGLQSILHDYVYNYAIVYVCSNLVILSVSRIILESLL